ncbi:Alpha/Beta hydrolase protein [Xylariales sp. AK1849]|nr:Alpha/Beta hydrolase protein [Xylariales sp. AK1849]
MRYSFVFTVLLAKAVVSVKTPIDAALLTTFERYAAFASASYSSDCTIPPYGSVVVNYINDDTTDTQATLFRDDTAAEFILSFRGTSTIQDFITDEEQDLVSCVAPGIECLGCTCAEGYLGQYNAVADQVKSDIDAGLAEYSGYNLTVTGHSMGGALASLGAASLQGQGYSLVPYSYGQPRTGDQTYADYIDTIYNGTFYRLTHENDGVPQIPSRDDGYEHHSTEYWQSVDPPTTNDTYKCQGQEPADCNQSEIGYGIGSADGIGINLAHLSYFGVSTGDPLDPDAACRGIV